MTMIRLTIGQAPVHYLWHKRAQPTGASHPLFAGVFAISGHVNVAVLGLMLPSRISQHFGMPSSAKLRMSTATPAGAPSMDSAERPT